MTDSASFGPQVSGVNFLQNRGEHIPISMSIQLQLMLMRAGCLYQKGNCCVPGLCPEAVNGGIASFHWFFFDTSCLSGTSLFFLLLL